MPSLQQRQTFSIAYSFELAQYVVERGEMRIVPTKMPVSDTDAAKRAAQVCETLNRVYGADVR